MIKWHLQVVSVVDVVPVPWNPREISEKDYAQLEHSMKIFGLIDKPIVNADMTCIGGHQRISVLRNQGVERVEVWMPERLLSKEEVRELNLRLNRNHGEFDYDLLANEFEIEELFQFGFDEEELGLPKDEKKKKQKYKIDIEFADKDSLESALSEIYEISVGHDAKVKVKM